MSTTSGQKKKKTLTLKSSDNVEFNIEQSVAAQCIAIKNMVDDGYGSDVIPLPNVKSHDLATLIPYLEKHTDPTLSEDDLKQFDSEFVNKKGFSELRELLLAANFLVINSLLELCIAQVAKKMENKSVEKVREVFGIENDFTPEEEAEHRKHNKWAFEGVNDDDD